MGLDNWPNYLIAQKGTQLLRSTTFSRLHGIGMGIGNGSRPDSPSPEIDGSYSFRNYVSNTSFEVKENSTGSDSNVVVKCSSHAPHGVPSQHVFPRRGSHFGIALPPAVLYGQYPNLGYGYSGIALPPVVTLYQHDPNPVYGYHADPNHPAEHFSGVDEASHVDEDPSSVHDSEFPSLD